MPDINIKKIIGRKLASTNFVKRAIEENADLRAFKEKPTPRIIFGLFLILFSYLIAWPAISALGIVSIYFKNPFIVAVGGPLLYGTSHLVFLAGIYLTGAQYSMIFMRWAARSITEKLLR